MLYILLAPQYREHFIAMALHDHGIDLGEKGMDTSGLDAMTADYFKRHDHDGDDYIQEEEYKEQTLPGIDRTKPPAPRRPRIDEL